MTSTAAYQVVAVSNAAVFVNGLPAQPGTYYAAGDIVEIDVASGGYVTLSRTPSGGASYLWNHFTSVGGASFQAIWIGD